MKENRNTEHEQKKADVLILLLKAFSLKKELFME